ncbi:MAG: hypothetical protein VYC39_07350 [Myxococcota bacterium]|nr:hypothetical protein [Myxococcota bacterium]
MNGLIIDIHDVIVDTSAVRAQAWREACEFHGFEISLDSVREHLIQPSNIALINTIGIGISSPDGKKIYERYLDLLIRRFIGRVIPPLGIDSFLKVLKNVAMVRQVGLINEDPTNHLMRYLRAAKAEFLFQELPQEEQNSGLYSFREGLHSALERMSMSAQSSVLITANPERAQAARQLNLPVVIVGEQQLRESSAGVAVRSYRSTKELSERFYEEIAPLLAQ